MPVWASVGPFTVMEGEMGERSPVCEQTVINLCILPSHTFHFVPSLLSSGVATYVLTDSNPMFPLCLINVQTLYEHSVRHSFPCTMDWKLD